MMVFEENEWYQMNISELQVQQQLSDKESVDPLPSKIKALICPHACIMVWGLSLERLDPLFNTDPMRRYGQPNKANGEAQDTRIECLSLGRKPGSNYMHQHSERQYCRLCIDYMYRFPAELGWVSSERNGNSSKECREQTQTLLSTNFKKEDPLTGMTE